jgi:hypothetical protein
VHVQAAGLLEVRGASRVGRVGLVPDRGAPTPLAIIIFCALFRV